MKSMSRPSSYSPEIRERAVRMVAESKASYGSELEAIKSIASKLDIGSAETLRKWVRRAEKSMLVGGPVSRLRSRSS
jgi:transposase